MDSTYTIRGAYGEPIAEYAGGTPVLQYWNYIRPDGVVIGRKEGSNRFFYHRDHLGSTRTVLNASSGVVETYDYMPFGEFMSGRITTSGTGTRPKFTGHAFDDETDLHTMQWRRQIPRYGVFRTPDPKADSYPGWNAYAYVMNDPMRLTDPTGLCPEDGSAGMDQETGRYCTEAVVVTADRLPWTLHVTYARPNFIHAASNAIPVSVWNTTRSASKGSVWAKALAAGLQLGVLISATHNWLTFKDSEEIDIMLSGVSNANALLDKNELARRLGIPRSKVHEKKREILSDPDVSDAKRRTGDSNVDILVSPNGNVVVRGNLNKKEIDTGVPLESFKD